MGDEEGLIKDIGRNEMVGWRMDNKGGWEVDATVFTCGSGGRKVKHVKVEGSRERRGPETGPGKSV